MKPYAWIVLYATLAAMCLGCGSSDSTDPPMDMDQIAAIASQQRESTESAGTASSKTAASQSPAPAGRDAHRETPSPNPNLETRRGFDLKDWSNEAAYVLVKAAADQTAAQLAREWNGKVLKDVLGKPIDEERGQAVVYQLAGHPWSIFATDSSQLEELVPVLSRQTDLLVFWNSDFNGWAGIELYRAGEEVEAIHWGVAEDALGEDANAALWHSEGQVTETYDDGVTMDYAFRFRSKLRKVTPVDLQQGEAFVNAFMRHHDAYLPDADQMPWVDENNFITSPLGPAAFTAVHAVEVESPE